MQNIKKRFDGEDLDDIRSSEGHQSPRYSRPSGDLSRRSGDRDRYDADHQLLSDDFASFDLRDNEGEHFSFPFLLSLSSNLIN